MLTAPFASTSGYAFYDQILDYARRGYDAAIDLKNDANKRLTNLEVEATKSTAYKAPTKKTHRRPETARSTSFRQQAREYAAFVDGLGLRYITGREVVAPHCKRRRGVGNSIPPRHLWQNIVPTLRAADEIRHRLGVPLLAINSAYRSPAYNNTCPGAAKRSTHMQNLALDLVYDCGPKRVFKMAKQLRKEGYFKGGVGRYSSFTHIDTRGANATWS